MNNQPNINQVLSGFAPARQIGQGGMASIYLYENRLTGETVAVKSLHPGISKEKDAVSRFYHEVQACIRLDHKNIVKVLGFGEWQSTPSIVLEYIDGGDLKDLIERVGMLPPETAIYLAIQIFKGLDYSHRLGIIHRDIKPSNILIDKTGVVKISDFGISKVSDLTRLTHSGDVLGTPAYMSPEQASGEKLDERTDIFSMGVMLFEILTGVNPFQGESPSITILNIIRCNPRSPFELNPTIPSRIEAVIDSFLTRYPDDRCQSASDAALVLSELLKEIAPEGYTQDHFSEFLSDPHKTISMKKKTESRRFLEIGKQMYQEASNRPEMAFMEFYKSLYLDPDNIEAQQFLTSITDKFASKSKTGLDKKIIELEETLRQDPTNVAVLLQLVKRYRAEGDFIKAISCSKKLVKLRPKDPYLLSQVETLLPRDYDTAVAIDSREPDATISRASTAAYKKEVRHPATKSALRTEPLQKDRPSKPVDPAIIFVVVGLVAIVLGAVYIAKQFRKASDGMVSEIPAIVESINKSTSESNAYAQPPSLIQKSIPAEARKKLNDAEESYKNGDRRKTAEIYAAFIHEYPTLPETENLRLQLAQLYVGIGSKEDALTVLESQIQKGQTKSLTAQASLAKIKILQDSERFEEARWECVHMEPGYKQLSSQIDQITYLSIYANLCESSGQLAESLALYNKIINEYPVSQKTMEVRLLKADVLIKQGSILEAQRELWLVRDQNRSDSFLHKTAVEKLESIDPGSESSEKGLSE